VSRLASVKAKLLRKHSLDVDKLIGFACGARCVCAYLHAVDQKPPCIHCRARAYSADFRAFADKVLKP
jgi:hypothetical protein